jgi:Na+-driven multidrug efflux pump
MGTCIASAIVSGYAVYNLWRGNWVAGFPKGGPYKPDFAIIRALFKFGLPTGIQGIAMNIGGVFMLSFIGAAGGAAAMAAFSVSYNQIFSFITWTSVGLMGAAAAVAGQNLGAGHPDRALHAVHAAARFGVTVAIVLGALFLLIPKFLLGLFGLHDPEVIAIGVSLLRVLSVSGLFITTALTYTGGLQGTGDTKSPLYISIVSQVIVPLGTCFIVQRVSVLDPMHIWLAILAGHITRCLLSVIRFRQGEWRNIEVAIG